MSSISLPHIATVRASDEQPPPPESPPFWTLRRQPASPPCTRAYTQAKAAETGVVDSNGGRRIEINNCTVQNVAPNGLVLTKKVGTAFALLAFNRKYRKVSSSIARRRTFHSWPLQMCEQIPKLVEAGFCYTGKSDCVQCLVCGVKVDQWLKADSARLHHVKASENCSFCLIFTPSFGLSTPTVDLSDPSFFLSRVETFKEYDMGLLEDNMSCADFEDAHKFARAGFVCTGGREIQCCICKCVLVDDLRFRVSPLEAHKFLNPGCLFLKMSCV